MNNIPPNRKALEEALNLSEDILKNLELSEIPLTNIALKAGRLARLLNEMEIQKIMKYEVSGYPSIPSGLAPDIYQLAASAGREFQQDNKGQLTNYVYIESIEELEHQTKIAETALDAAKDRNVSISSANPYQTVYTPVGNWYERQQIRDSASRAAKRLSSRRSLIYHYVLTKHYELKFSGIADDIFSRIRERVDSAIGKTVPDAIQKLTSVNDNLRSENPEDWSNAVHSCRRVLQDLANAIYPPREDKEVVINNKLKIIKLGEDNYINRIIAFVEENSTSNRFNEIVGSHISFIGDRLDSIFKAAQKGSHYNIVSREEADRYVVYTYLIIGDILSLIR
ncbi:MAG: hypothetical protein HY753_03020 [Nitrospirae bacterium]|nr:hypothetical protein [Nitrospirota bacterium]